MEFSDTLTLDAPRRTADGYLAASVRAARTGVQEYTGREVGKPDQQIVRVFRPEAEVFHKDSLRTLAHKPVTVDHPPVAVTADNWREYTSGMTGDEVARDGEFVRVPLAIMDATAIKAVTDGKNQLSCGYVCDLDWTAGTAPDGTTYDAVQKNIRFNHLSIVGLARGGPQLRIGDSKPMRKIVHDGISIDFEDQAADAYNTLAKRLADTVANVAKLTADLAAKDAAIAKADAERDAAKAKVMDAVAIDALVAKRADLIAVAKSIHEADYTGKPDAEIRKIAVAAKIGDAAIAGKPDAYIEAMFDIKAGEAKQNVDLRQTIGNGLNTAPAGSYQATVDAARKAAVDLNAWRNEKQA